MGLQMIRVMIADDHQFFADGLSQALNSLPDTRVVGVVNSGPGSRRGPDDPTRRGLDRRYRDARRRRDRQHRETGTAQSRAIVVSMHASDEQRQRARDAGARGFFSKGVPLVTLAAAVRAVADGKNLLDLNDEERDELLETYREAQLDPGAASLTAREREILQLLAVGVSATDELVDRLYISPKTVKNHLASIFQKLAVSDRTQAAIEAIRLGIAKPS